MQSETQNEQKPLYRIDINKLIQSYLIEYIRCIYNEAIIKFPKDPMIQINYSYFALHYMRNAFVSLNILTSFDKNFSTINNLSYKVNEAYLIYQLRKILDSKH